MAQMTNISGRQITQAITLNRSGRAGLRIRALPHWGQHTTRAAGRGAGCITSPPEGAFGSESGLMVLLFRPRLRVVFRKALMHDIISPRVGQGPEQVEESGSFVASALRVLDVLPEKSRREPGSRSGASDKDGSEGRAAGVEE
jgi:hypothetical protein